MSIIDHVDRRVVAHEHFRMIGFWRVKVIAWFLQSTLVSADHLALIIPFSREWGLPWVAYSEHG